MNRFTFLVYCCMLFNAGVLAQSPPAGQDSLHRNVTVAVKPLKDSIGKRDSGSAKPGVLLPGLRKADSIAKAQQAPIDFSNTAYSRTLKKQPYFNFSGTAVSRIMIPHPARTKDGIFYLLAGLVFLLAIVKASFGRYFQNLFAVFFRASMKQKQIREQLLQTPLASLLLNILFIAAGGLFAAFVLASRFASGQKGPMDFWILYGYSIAGLALLYLGKYTILKMIGWVLKMENTTDTYLFIVFMCNKVLAIFLLPVLLVLAFGNADAVTAATTVATVLIVGVFAYRYISAYGFINREVRTSRFHFFLYLCAFEVAPLLLIYKVLLKIV